MVKTCDNCGNPNVSDDFHRLFSNNDGELAGCIDCTTGRERKELYA